jgi:hypothetical protein
VKGPRLRGDEPKPLRMELLQTKGELERELERFLLHCRRCNRRVHRFPGQVRGALGSIWSLRRTVTNPTSAEWVPCHRSDPVGSGLLTTAPTNVILSRRLALPN